MLKTEWVDFYGPWRDLDVAALVIYPGIFSSHPDLHKQIVKSVDFVRKGRKLYEATYEGNSMVLLHVCGHLPWALVKAGEECGGQFPGWDDLCFQPGCSSKSESTYQLKKEYCRAGHGEENAGALLRRRFCKLHLRRGDCGFEDADENYIVIEGAGLSSGATGWKDFESQSKEVFLDGK